MGILLLHPSLRTSDSHGEDRRAVDSDSIPGFTVVLPALSGTDLGEGVDGTGPGAPHWSTDTDRVITYYFMEIHR